MKLVNENTIIFFEKGLTPTETRDKLVEYFVSIGYDNWDADMAAMSARLFRNFWSEQGEVFTHDCSLHHGLTCGYSDSVLVVVACDWINP